MAAMTVPLLVVATHLLLGDPSTALEAECKERRKAGHDPAVVADVCRRAFEAVPGGPADRRTLLLAAAHGLYKKALRVRPDRALACADAAMLRTYAAELDLLAVGERPGDREDVKKAIEEVDPRLVADCIQPETPPLSTTPPSATTSSPRPPPREIPLREPQTTDRPRRRLRLVGGALVGVGLGSGLAMVGALVRGANLRTRAESVHASYTGETAIPMDVETQYRDDMARGSRSNHLAIAFGVSAAALAGIGAALLIVDGRGKARRVALSPLGLPTPGIRFSMEF